MSTTEYDAPQVTSLGGAATAVIPMVLSPAVEVPTPAVSGLSAPTEASYDKGTAVIGLSKMVNAKGTLITDIMVERIEAHMQFLSGKKRFKTKEEEVTEQVSFIETIGNSLKLDFPQFVLVTDDMLNAIRANPAVFEHGLAFRFTLGLDKKYPPQYIRSYQTYIQFLTMVSKNWVSRYKLGKLIDLAHVIHDFDRKGKENITQYFRHLTNV